MADTNALVAATTIAGVVVGGGLQALQQRAGQKARRHELASDRLWAARRETYAQFLIGFNDAAHVLGNLAPRSGRTVPSGPDAREHAEYHFDRTITPPLRALQLVATPDANRLAMEAWAALDGFRARMTHPERPAPEYRSSEYNVHYQPAQEARQRFIEQAVIDLKSLA